jgi:chemotaxis protein MotB
LIFWTKTTCLGVVVGKEDSEPLTPEDPFLPENQRINLILLRNSPALPPDMR